MAFIAHCQRGNPGGVTVLAINLEDSPTKLAFSAPADLYALTAEELQSRTVLLNGEPLELGPEDTLPKLSPTRINKDQVTLAPTSVNFVTLPQADNPSCRSL